MTGNPLVIMQGAGGICAPPERKTGAASIQGDSNRYLPGTGRQCTPVDGELHSFPGRMCNGRAHSSDEFAPREPGLRRIAVPAIATLGKTARYTLGGIRVVNGAVALLAPAVIVGRFGDVAPGRNPAAIYGLRLFGIRTVLIGVDLIRLRGRDLDRALREAPIIHASDTATVLGLLRSKQLLPERARPLVLISGLNTALAVTALLGSRRSRA
jgi:hypothetical protein